MRRGQERAHVLVIFVLVMLCSAAEAVQQADESGFGGIEGRVVSSEGVAVKDAKVAAQPVDPHFIGKLRYSFTDENGNFLLTHVIAGTCLVSAGKESEGYPNSLFAAFAEDLHHIKSLPRVVVLPDQTTRNVIVTLGPKGGKLVGVVIDVVTRTAITTARVTLVREDDPKFYYSTTVDEHGAFDFALPVKAFTMEVAAPGYSTWKSLSLSDSDTRGGFTIPSGRRKEILVAITKTVKTY